MTTTEMLRKSKLDIYGLGCPHDKFIECVERFAELIRAQENEACALIADEAEPYNSADLIRKRVKA